MTSHKNDKEMITDEDDEIDDTQPKPMDGEVMETVFTNFISKPQIKTKFVNEGVNTLTVKSVEVFKDACGTGSLKIGDSTTLMNICESEGKISADLSFIVEGTEYENIKFEIKVGEGDLAEINRNTLTK
jgi:hypothetical protein